MQRSCKQSGDEMRKRIKTIIYALWVLIACCVVTACGGDDGVSEGGKQQVEDQDEDDTKATLDENYEYKLPVIFHVIYKDANDASQYIPSARLQQLLTYVNMIYSGGLFGESENVNVKFVAATYDEKGNKLDTPGVEYVKWNGAYPISPLKFMGDNSGKYVSYLWDPNEYINVMMYNFADGGDSDEGTVLGISHMPYTIVGSTALEGLETTKAKNIQKRQLKYPHCVSINSLYANKNGNGGYYESDRYANSNHEATYISPFDVVVTLSHELGHYLGLFHAFSEHKVENADGTTTTDTSEGCYDTDYCDDTPSYNRTEYMEYIEYYMKSHSTPRLQDVLLRTPCEGDNYLSANIMDYSYTLGYKISAQQKARIRNVMYYSPLIPGPKKNGANTRAAGYEAEGKLDLKPIVIK